MTINKLTYSDIGKIIGVSQQVVGHKLYGISDWKISEIEKLCDLFGKSYEELFK